MRVALSEHCRRNVLKTDLIARYSYGEAISWSLSFFILPVVVICMLLLEKRLAKYHFFLHEDGKHLLSHRVGVLLLIGGLLLLTVVF